MRNIQRAYNEIISLLEENGLKGEVANEATRGILPMDIESKLALAVNIEGLIHLAHKRLCFRTQSHTRKIVSLIIKEVLKIIPELKPYLVPECQYLLWCPENHKKCPLMMSGAVLSKDEVKDLILNSKIKKE